jgi:hypothetical protein
MSKNRKKHSVKLSPGDSVLVLSYDTLLYLAETFDLLAVDQNNQEDAAAWRSIADEIRFQAEENYYKPVEDEEEYWV